MSATPTHLPTKAPAHPQPIMLRGAPRVAIVHEWLVQPAGSEAVLRELVQLFPQADLFCVIDALTPADRQRLGLGRTRATWLQALPGVGRYYRALLPLMPHAIEQLPLQGYDLVISNSHAVAKGVRPRADALHLCYCCSPMRYAWDLRERYLAEAGMARGPVGWGVRQLLERLRRWDLESTERVSSFVTISTFIADRVRRAYNRDSTVVYPPVDTDYFTPDPQMVRGTHYLTVSRLVGYKRVANIVEAFRELPDRQLLVIGDGPDRRRVLEAAGPNVTWLGHQPRGRLREEMRRARAFIFAAEEDFGIVTVEAQACDTPVVALGVGGSREIVQPHTGGFFDEATPSAIAAAIRRFEAAPPPEPAACRRNAERFAADRFRRELTAVICDAWESHGQR